MGSSGRWHRPGVPVAGHAQSSRPAPTFTKDVAAIFQEKCESCHRPDSIAPMSLVTYEESAALGALDQEPRRRAPDAALAHRQDHRHPALPERSLADRRADRHHRALGRRRRAEGRPEGHAAAGQVGRRQRLELRRALRRSAGSRSSSRRPTRSGRWRRTPGSSRSSRRA